MRNGAVGSVQSLAFWASARPAASAQTIATARPASLRWFGISDLLTPHSTVESSPASPRSSPQRFALRRRADEARRIVRIALGGVVDRPLDGATGDDRAAHDLVGVAADADRHGHDRTERSTVDVAELGAVEGADRLAVEGQLPALILVAHREYLLVVRAVSATLEPARGEVRAALRAREIGCAQREF